MEQEKKKIGDAPRKMTVAQSIELQKAIGEKIRLWWALAIAIGSLSLLLLLFPAGSGINWLFGLFVGGFVIFSVGNALWTRHLLQLDLESALAEVEGVIELDVLTNMRGTVGYRLRVEGYEFMVSKELFLSLSNHQPYRIYFAPKSRYILGTEAL